MKKLILPKPIGKTSMIKNIIKLVKLINHGGEKCKKRK